MLGSRARVAVRYGNIKCSLKPLTNSSKLKSKAQLISYENSNHLELKALKLVIQYVALSKMNTLSHSLIIFILYSLSLALYCKKLLNVALV